MINLRGLESSKNFSSPPPIVYLSSISTLVLIVVTQLGCISRFVFVWSCCDHISTVRFLESEFSTVESRFLKSEFVIHLNSKS